MEYLIRHMVPEEFPMLEDFLYEAIYVPEGFEAPRDVHEAALPLDGIASGYVTNVFQ